jgi:lipid II:glycine glycyltransferase (peptidoglycan interpeptide bridge formation enzyme)
MRLRVTPKKVTKLFPTDIVFQTRYWAQVKANLGWKPRAYDIDGVFSNNDMLVLIKSLGGGISAAYIPQGPEFAPNHENYGPYLEELSESIAGQLDADVAFIRYDLPWESPYADMVDNHPRRDFPDARIREMRMNFGTQRWNLKKAPMDMTVADTYMIDISDDEEAILSRMRSKTRYNIGLASRKGVRVCAAFVEKLPVFHELYLQTARRNGFFICDYRYFSALFSPSRDKRDSSDVILLMAMHGPDILAGAIITISEKNAFFLHGGSSNVKRNYMGSYALHWAAIKHARSLGCRIYDMGAVPPAGFSDHPFFGLYRFKTGFGGRILHRVGSWDYPINEDVYAAFRNWERLHGGYEIGRKPFSGRVV